MIAKAIATIALAGLIVEPGAAQQETVKSGTATDAARETASLEDCAIFAAIALGEIARPAEPNIIRLPAPRRDLGALASRVDRWAAYAEKLKDWDPANIISYDQWVIQEADRLREIEDFPDYVIGETVTATGKARAPYRQDCNWSEHDVTFVPDPKQERQWLVFGQPVRVDDGDYAVVDISYGYSNWQARDAVCALERQGDKWRLLECVTTLMS